VPTDLLRKVKMIEEIKLRFGSDKDSAPLIFSPAIVTVIVGPNNSGKSLLLRELENFCSGQKKMNTYLMK
jgi:hypothetical protein